PPAVAHRGEILLDLALGAAPACLSRGTTGGYPPCPLAHAGLGGLAGLERHAGRSPTAPGHHRAWPVLGEPLQRGHDPGRENRGRVGRSAPLDPGQLPESGPGSYRADPSWRGPDGVSPRLPARRLLVAALVRPVSLPAGAFCAHPARAPHAPKGAP